MRALNRKLRRAYRNHAGTVGALTFGVGGFLGLGVMGPLDTAPLYSVAGGCIVLSIAVAMTVYRAVTA